MFRQCGLRVERIPYYVPDLTIHGFDMTTPERAAFMKEKLSKMYVWRITAMQEEEQGSLFEKSEQFSSKFAILENGTFCGNYGTFRYVECTGTVS